ncbi:MAG: DegT/DnrJ/EryC1/StrS family aminotransferase [Gemmatimonadetes bacterium]|nr:DegT/DnrJ/EryC1/StrS family aminotransferase [Gemmatimonadota bacterium]
MPVPFLDLTAQYRSIRAELDAAMARVVESQRFILGPEVERFEAECAAYLGARHAIGCANGTDAILLALKALRLQLGDEVIVPAFTFFATAGAVWNAGLRPIFADVDPRTFNVTAETVRAVLSDRTRAIVVVHLFGQMADMPPILALARDRGLAVVEDAAQAFGARQEIDGEWRAAGTLGDVGTFSFFPTKNLGGFGDGGLLTTGDDELADRLRKLRVHGGRQMYHHEMVGTNSRLDALQAAVLSAKLPHLDGWAEARRRNAGAYDERLAGVPGVTTPTALPRNHHVYNQYTIRTERRDELKRRLDDCGIGNAIYYPVPLHLQECFAPLGYRAGDLPVSERAAREVLSLPVYPELSGAQLDEVASEIAAFHGAPAFAGGA